MADGSLDSFVCVMPGDFATGYPWGVGTKVTGAGAKVLISQ